MTDKKTSETAKIKKKINNEACEIRKALKDTGFCQKNMPLLQPIIRNVATMKIKLDIAREELISEGLTIEYNNGGGQSGIKENPTLTAYEGLWKSYLQGMNKILDAAQVKDTPQTLERTECKTVLELVKEKHKKEA